MSNTEILQPTRKIENIPRKPTFTPKFTVGKTKAKQICWVNNVHYITLLELLFLSVGNSIIFFKNSIKAGILISILYEMRHSHINLQEALNSPVSLCQEIISAVQKPPGLLVHCFVAYTD